MHSVVLLKVSSADCVLNDTADLVGNDERFLQMKRVIISTESTM